MVPGVGKQGTAAAPAAAALVALVWLTPVAVVAGLVLLLRARRPRPA